MSCAERRQVTEPPATPDNTKMRKCKIFVGNSHPELGKLICDRLGVEPAECTLKKFSNGETSVQIGVSVRDEDVYIVQSGSTTVNDHIMELLILISAARGGSANKITAVIPQFPYAKQSKMKKHRGAITARMLANLLIMAGADHIISMDLHASQMQGFFSKPVDNLYAGPTLAKWIKQNVEDYQNSVIVSKNPGGTKRVTALADSLKVNFAMIHTDRRRTQDALLLKKAKSRTKSSSQGPRPVLRRASLDDEEEEQQIFTSKNMHTARLVQGHVVDDDYAEESAAGSNSMHDSVYSTGSNLDSSYALGGTVDATESDDDDIEVYPEKLITLVGDVKGKPAIILDDMIDRPGSFIAAAEHCRRNCGAKSVFIVATHGIFTETCLEELTASDCIDKIVVTNTFPIPEEKRSKSHKLVVIDVSSILAECIRRDHFGESISVLFGNSVAL